jgi:hypothetical protein
MKRKWRVHPKYLIGLMGAVLVMLVVQYALVTDLVDPVHPVFAGMQMFCYMLLAVAIFRGFIERSRLAWLVAQLMLCALFDFCLLFAAISAVLSAKTGDLWGMLAAAAVTVILNGMLMAFLFSFQVRHYFRPLDDDE